MPTSRRNTPPPEPPPAVLKVSLADAHAYIGQRVSLGEEFLTRELRTEDEFRDLEHEADRWRDHVRTWLDQYLGGEPAKEWRDASHDVMFVGGSLPIDREVYYFQERVRRQISTLRSVDDRLEFWAPKGQAPATREQPGSRIFIVHGSDTEKAEVVSRLVDKATKGESVILHEQPNEGQTLIEKFEAHAAEAAYAVVILTADDMGGPAGGTMQPRGRQNVVFELGFFFGSIGRRRVCVLLAKGVEQPSDIAGLVYVSMAEDDWRGKLKLELAKAGLVPS